MPEHYPDIHCTKKLLTGLGAVLICGYRYKNLEDTLVRSLSEAFNTYWFQSKLWEKIISRELVQNYLFKQVGGIKKKVFEPWLSYFLGT